MLDFVLDCICNFPLRNWGNSETTGAEISDFLTPPYNVDEGGQNI